MKNVIGMDVDGVLANFNEGFRKQFIAITGEDKFFEGPFVGGLEPPEWNYPTGTYGYTKEQTNQVWDHIINHSQTFWRDLEVLEKDKEIRYQLNRLGFNGDSLYFLTSREGPYVQDQTRFWLERVLGILHPSVLICDHKRGKGELAYGLGLTHFFDDKPENCVDVKGNQPSCNVYLVDCRYNKWAHADMKSEQIVVIGSPSEILRVL